MKTVKIVLITLAIVCSANLNAQDNASKKLTPADRKYTGKITKKDFSTEYTKSWFNRGMEHYDIPASMLEEFEATSYKNYSIKAFMGTWCHDSKREIPRLYKLLDELDFNLDNLEVYAVNYRKKTEANYEAGLDIHHVPTIIVYDQNGEEINRYVEKPRQSFLKDMLKIFQKNPYNNIYKR